MKAEVKRIRIWDGNSSEYDKGNNDFGPCVFPFAAKVDLGDWKTARGTITIINAKSLPESDVVVLATDREVESLWKKFVLATGFGGSGNPKDIADRFAAYAEKIELPSEVRAPGPYSESGG